MVNQQTVAESDTTDAVGGGELLAATSTAVQDTSLLVNDFTSWPDENQLGEYTDAGALENGGGSGDVVDGALRLEYDGGGWFRSNVRQDVSDFTHLEMDVRGESVDEDGVQLEVGAVQGMVSDWTTDSIDSEFSTLSIDLRSTDVDRSSVDDIELNFWQTGSGVIEIDTIQFVAATDGEGPPNIGDYEPADTTGDGLYNDIDGSGSTTTTDVTTFFENVEDPAVADYPEYYDFDGNGAVSITDVIELFDSL